MDGEKMHSLGESSQVAFNKSFLGTLLETTCFQDRPQTYRIRVFGEKGLGIHVLKCAWDDS